MHGKGTAEYDKKSRINSENSTDDVEITSVDRDFERRYLI